MAYEADETDDGRGPEDLTQGQLYALVEDHSEACECEACRLAFPDQYVPCDICHKSRNLHVLATIRDAAGDPDASVCPQTPDGCSHAS